MINCPKCGTRTGVYDSRISFEGKTRRKRLCPSCGHRFATIEIFDTHRVLNKRDREAPAPKKARVAKPVKKVEKKRDTVPKRKAIDEGIDQYEDSLDEDFYEVARELGIGGLDNYD